MVLLIMKIFKKENGSVYKKTYPNILKEKESKNKKFSKKIFYPDRPDF